MKAVVQRVSSASVSVESKEVAAIGPGLAVLVAVAEGDTEADADQLANKVASLRIFDNEQGQFDRSVMDVRGSALVVSNFTLYGDCRKGRRPSFTDAANPELARRLYERFAESLARVGVPVSTGVFQARMSVRIENDGPVTLIVESRKGLRPQER